MQPIIRVSNLSKTYAGGFQALKNVDLEIHKGEIFGLLGPNGAGKTTLINIVCGIVTITSGTVTVAGYDIVADYRETRSRIGLVPQELPTETFETPFNVCRLSRGLFGKPEDPEYIEKVLRSLSLWDRKDEKIMLLSGGMKRRLAIARSMMTSPKVIVMDEPTTGLDPQSRNRVWEEMAVLKDSGVTILLSTHYMEEATILCDRLSIMDHGKILDEGTPDQMIERHAPKEVAQLRVVPAALRSVREYLTGRNISYREVGALVSVTGANGDRPDLSGLEGVEGVRTSYRAGNLEDVFLAITGRGLRDG